jgi:hypothetical protein
MLGIFYLSKIRLRSDGGLLELERGFIRDQLVDRIAEPLQMTTLPLAAPAKISL